MAFFLSKTLWFVAQPSNLVFLLLLLAGLILALRPFSRPARRLALIAIVLLALGGLLPLGRWLSAPLEDRFARPAEIPAKVDGIVVLGGAIRPKLSADRGEASLNEHAERMTEGMTLALRHPQARLLFTGGSGALLPGRLTEAEIAAALYRDLGLPAERSLFERASRNTYENALFSRELAKPQPGETWLLVTSALHMPRSMAVFRRTGWRITPWPVDYETGGDEAAGWSFLPLAYWRQLDAAAHEWVGLLAYRLMGWSEELFPAP